MTRKLVSVSLALALAGCGGTHRAAEPEATPSAGPASPPPSSSPSSGPAPAPPDYVAQGNEPFWRVETHPGRMVYSSPDRQDGADLETTATKVEGWSRFEGLMDGHRLVLEVREGQCFDGMSGFEFSHQARVIRSDGTWPGCAHLASEPQPRE